MSSDTISSRWNHEAADEGIKIGALSGIHTFMHIICMYDYC